MNRENRKVLISVKVSTLLLILIAIIGIVVLVNVIKNNILPKQEVAIENNEKISEEIINTEKETTRVISPDITSRGTEEVRVENTQDTSVTEPVILQGAVGKISFENSIQEEVAEPVQELPKTTPIEEVTISRDMDLTVRTGLSREDFITLISGVEEDTSGFFEENAGLIYDICEEYQINEIFFCGLIAGESGWRIADNHRRTYNYISLMSSNGLIRFSSVEDGLVKAAQALHNNYLTEGGRFYHGPTLAGVKTRFCPASSTWVNLIYGNMQRILK